jgi:hypothetical protein
LRHMELWAAQIGMGISQSAAGNINCSAGRLAVA